MANKLYLSVVQDRHNDAEYRLFRDALDAIHYTGVRFREVVAHPNAIIKDGRYWSYEYESDYAEVVEVNEP